MYFQIISAKGMYDDIFLGLPFGACHTTIPNEVNGLKGYQT